MLMQRHHEDYDNIIAALALEKNSNIIDFPANNSDSISFKFKKK